MVKLRVVGQASPGTLVATPVAGTTSSPRRSAWSAARKKPVPLQNETWPKMEPLSPLTQRPWASAVGVAPTWVRLVPLKPKSMVTTAFGGRVGTTGAAAGVVPCVMTSGSYTDSAPVAGFRMVAWTKAPRFPALAMVQPEAAGVIPLAPVSWYGVARPCADSGFAGTMMSQETLAAAAAAAAAAVAVGLAETVGDVVAHGVAAAVVAAAVVAAAAAAVVAAAVAVGVATAPVGVGATVAAVFAAAAAVVVADGVAQAVTLAALLAPKTLLTPGTSSATPTPATTATAPVIATIRARDRGSNSRSWLKTLFRYDTTPFPFAWVSLPGDHISPVRESRHRKPRFS